jgi:hypothetical protein
MDRCVWAWPRVDGRPARRSALALGILANGRLLTNTWGSTTASPTETSGYFYPLFLHVILVEALDIELEVETWLAVPEFAFLKIPEVLCERHAS